jgi:hypothetical protein
MLLALFATYLGLAVAATWPLAAMAGDHLFGLGTPPLNVWAMDAVLRSLGDGSLRLLDGTAFYPYRDTVAFSEHLFVPALLGAPVALTTGNPVLAHNAVAFLSYGLAGLGMFLLAHELSGSPWGALLAGAFFAINTWNVNELVRLQIVSNQWFPFLLLALLRYFHRPSPKAAGAIACLYVLQSLSCMYWALYAPLLIGPALIFLQWRRRLSLRQLVPIGIGLALGGLLLVPFALPYLEQSAAFGFTRQTPPPVALDRYLDVLPGNWLFASSLGTARPNRDAAHFLGFSTLALALFGLRAGRVRHPQLGWRTACLVLAAGGLLLSLGPELRAGGLATDWAPYRLLRDYVPGFRNVRYPERFALFVHLGVAPLAAAGVTGLGRLARVAGPVLVVVVALEHLSSPLELEPIPTGESVPPTHRWLAGRDDVHVVADVPGSHYLMDRLDAIPMYLSTVHGKRTPQGFTGYYPPIQNYVRWRLYRFPEPASVDFLRRFGVDALVVAPGRWNDEVEAVLPAVEQRRFEGGQRVVRLRSSRELLEPAEPPPTDLVEMGRGSWRVHASVEGARFAIDGNPNTAWTTGREQRGYDYFQVRFREPARVARISLAVSHPFQFPTALRLFVRFPGQGQQEFEIDLASAYDRMFRKLLHTPRTATLDLDLPDVPMNSFQLFVPYGDGFMMPWTLPEVRAYTRGASPP